MVDISLYNEWRPHNFNDFIGQKIPVLILKNSVLNNRIRQSYLFYGMHGSGKTSMARVFAAAINCQHPNLHIRPCNQCEACLSKNRDIVEIDAATNTSIEDVRALRERIQYLPEIGSKRIYIIDEIHRFSGSAFDAMLKMIEEPPPHVIFMMATTELEKVPDTIQSRCIMIPFYPVEIPDIEDHLSNIAVAEGISIDQQALHIIATESKGSVRDAVKLLDQLSIDPNGVIRVEEVQRFTGMINRDIVKRILYAMINGKSLELIANIKTAIRGGAIPSKLAQQIAEAAHSKLIHSLNNGETHQYDILAHITSIFSELVRNSQKTIESIDIEITAMGITIKNRPVINFQYFKDIFQNGEFESVLSTYTKGASTLVSHCEPINYNNGELTLWVKDPRLASSLSHPERMSIFEDVLLKITDMKISIIINS